MKILSKEQKIFYQCDCACAENKDIKIRNKKVKK